MKKSLGVLLIVFLSVLSFSYIQITGVDTNSYPQVIVFANMDVPDPDNANFYVIEDGNRYEAALSDVKAIMKKPEVDFIIVFDVTGSMDDEIQSVKAKIADFVDCVRSAGFDYRLSLVTFKDKVVKGDYGFTIDVNLFKRWLSSLYASGGGDTPESALDALVYAMKLPARRESMKVLILVTDAPYHYKGDGSGFSKYDVNDVRRMIERFGYILYSISPETSDYKRLVSGHGKVFNIHSSEGISSILDRIARSVTSQIAIVYTTDEKSSGQEVKFKVEAEYNGEKGTGTYYSYGNYIVPLRPKVENLTIIAEGHAFPDPTKPQAQAILMARQAAILDAKRSILETLSKVKIDKEVTIKDAVMSNEELKTKVNGVIAGGEVIYEENDDEWGYTVKVKANLESIYDDILHTAKYVPKWDKKIVVARGIVAINKKIKPSGRAALLARRGAIAEAQANLLAMIKGIHIDAHTTVEDEMTSNVELTARLEGVIKGAVIIDEMKNHMSLKEIMEKGYYWVSMAAPIDDEGLSYLLQKYGQNLKGSGTVLEALTGVPSKPSVSERPKKEKKEYKWIIINANGLKLLVTMKGYILCSRDGKVVYTPAESLDVPPMDMLPSLIDATRKHPNSVIYKAIEVDISNSKIIVDADYETLKKLIYDEGIYKNGGITVVSDSLLSGREGGD